MPNYTPEDFLPPASAEAAEDQERELFEGPFRLDAEKDHYLRFIPYKEVQGKTRYGSFGKRHFGVPGAATESGNVTFDCPAFWGSRCMVCEHEEDYRERGMWEYPSGCYPQLLCKFLVIDVENPDEGLQILEDKKSLFTQLKLKLRARSHLMNPLDGEILLVRKLDSDPWRQVEFLEDGRCSLEEIHDDALEWVLPENLTNWDLDETWNPPSLEEQMEYFHGHTQEQLDEPEEPEAIQGEVVDDDNVVEEESTPKEEASTKDDSSETKSSMIERLKAAREGNSDS